MISPLFKYHKCGDMKHLKELIEKNSFYLCPRKELNDIFDCFFRVTEEYLPKKIANIQVASLGTEARKRLIDHINLLIYQDFNPRITCFSEYNNNDILWSYYAEASRGVCLEFDFSSDYEKFKSIVQKVRYTDSFEISSQADLDVLPYRKKTSFIKEDEWRVVSMGKHERLPFSKSSLKAVYFGLRCKKSNVLTIMDILGSNDYNVEFYRMYFPELSNEIRFCPTDRKFVEDHWSIH